MGDRITPVEPGKIEQVDLILEIGLSRESLSSLRQGLGMVLTEINLNSSSKNLRLSFVSFNEYYNRIIVNK